VSALEETKRAARVAGFARRAAAHAAAGPGPAGHLSALLAGHRGVPVSGYMAMRSEIDPLPAMEEAAAHGPVCVPVIEAKAQPLKFALWEPGCEMVDGPFGARVPRALEFIEPEILIVPLVGITLTEFFIRLR